MPLYRIKKDAAERILTEDKHRREDYIHSLIENNVGIFFEGLILVAHKPRIGGKEFDTLAIDSVSKVPVIIEYKREKDRGVVEQVSLYYVKLRNNKPDVMKLVAKANAIEDLDEIDFDNPQIIVVAKEFTQEQRELLGLMKDYLRLRRFQVYKSDILTLEEVEPIGSSASMSKGKRGHPAQQGPYDVEHFGMAPDTLSVFKALDSLIILDSRVRPGKINKHFIGYGATGSYFATISPRVHSLKVEFKFRHKPPVIKKVKLVAIAENKHTPMTHSCKISAIVEAKALLPAIREALEASL